MHCEGESNLEYVGFPSHLRSVRSVGCLLLAYAWSLSAAPECMIMQIRVMPKCWFVLLRFWLRVDDTIIRIREARYFSELRSTSIVLRELKHVEGTFEELANAGAPSHNVRIMFSVMSMVRGCIWKVWLLLIVLMFFASLITTVGA